MNTRLIIGDDSIYEIDEDCMKRKYEMDSGMEIRLSRKGDKRGDGMPEWKQQKEGQRSRRKK